jgi:D-3-phosphoglycerate dehydrogenase
VVCQASELKVRVESLIMNSGGIRVVLEGWCVWGKVLFADRRPMSDESMRLLQSVGSVVWAGGDGEAELMRDMRDAEVVVSGLRLITRKVICSAEKLRGVVAYGVGLDHIDVAAATRRGVFVTNTPGVNSASVAEFAFGLMLAVARKIPQMNSSVKAGKWSGWEMVGSELWGKTLGIVGLGHVGTRVAALGNGFGMNVLSFTHHPSKERAVKSGVKFVDLDSLLKESDFVVLCCALTDETRGLIREREMGLLKRTAFFVNVARGSVADERALARALGEKRIAGAGIDVFEEEPPDQSNPLLRFENAIVTAHMAGSSAESLKRVSMTVAEEAVRMLKGEEPKFLVNKELSRLKR